MLQMVKNISLLIAIIFLMCGCNHLDLKGLMIPTSEGVDKRFEQSMAIHGGKSMQMVSTNDNYLFYVCADPHIDSSCENLTTFNDILRNDSEASFGVMLGDCIDRRDNHQAYLDAVAFEPNKHKYDYPYFHVLGNHDIFFNGWDAFKTIISPSVYWFEVRFSSGSDLYICLDTATGTLGRNQSEWLRSFLHANRDSYRHCIILTHTNIFYTDNSQSSSGNLPLEETFALLKLLSEHRVTLVLQGHDHYREDFTCDNVRYTIVGTIRDGFEKPEYLKIHITQDGIKYDWQVMK